MPQKSTQNCFKIVSKISKTASGIQLKLDGFYWMNDLGCFICVKMLKVQDPQWYSHYLTLFDDGITKILKKIWCWRVEHQGFVLCICRIKRTSPKNKFQHENHSYNASSDLDFQYISLVWTKIWEKNLFEILPQEG